MTQELLELLAAEEAVRTLDVQWALAQGCSPAAALASLHKARYEHTDMPDELRHESRTWLEQHGWNRLHGLPWPPAGELPKREES